MEFTVDPSGVQELSDLEVIKVQATDLNEAMTSLADAIRSRLSLSTFFSTGYEFVSGGYDVNFSGDAAFTLKLIPESVNTSIEFQVPDPPAEPQTDPAVPPDVDNVHTSMLTDCQTHLSSTFGEYDSLTGDATSDANNRVIVRYSHDTLAWTIKDNWDEFATKLIYYEATNEWFKQEYEQGEAKLDGGLTDAQAIAITFFTGA